MAEMFYFPPPAVRLGCDKVLAAVGLLAIYVTGIGSCTGIIGFSFSLGLHRLYMKQEASYLGITTPFYDDWLFAFGVSGLAGVGAAYCIMQFRRALKNIRQGMSEMFNGSAEQTRRTYEREEYYLREFAALKAKLGHNN